MAIAVDGYRRPIAVNGYRRPIDGYQIKDSVLLFALHWGCYSRCICGKPMLDTLPHGIGAACSWLLIGARLLIHNRA